MLVSPNKEVYVYVYIARVRQSEHLLLDIQLVSAISHFQQVNIPPF